MSKNRKVKKHKKEKKEKRSKKRKLSKLMQQESESEYNLSSPRHLTAEEKLEQTLTNARKLSNENNSEENNTKSFAESKKFGTRKTVSIALPGSILDNAQNRDLKAYLAGQVARALAVFSIDEVIVFDDKSTITHSETDNANYFLARLFQYLETPQYLRKDLFPRHQDLRYAGILNPIDAPHHLRANEISDFREGIIVESPFKKVGKFANIGLENPIKLLTNEVTKDLQVGTRVTVKILRDKKKAVGEIVNCFTPREEKGIYWGWKTRLCDNLLQVFSKSPFFGGYDLIVGTSENGTNEMFEKDFTLGSFDHLLIVFGGVQGLEKCVEDTKDFERKGIKRNMTKFLFQKYLNTCPGQSSRTIRTEEAILISLSALKPHIEQVVNTNC
eukprot:maker-scaffold_9-snap-gene-6.46-mRNA-1 protein AED:0.01 eAED:0.01 QI:52/1/1/1/1/1/2/29/386